MRNGHTHRITITTVVPYNGDDPHGLAQLLVELFKTFVRGWTDGAPTATTVTAAVDAPSPVSSAILAIGPHQINLIAEPFVTVTYPPGNPDATVLSIQPGGEIQTREEGTQGPYETAIRLPDRVIFAPMGPTGAVYIFPFTEQIPNA